MKAVSEYMLADTEALNSAQKTAKLFLDLKVFNFDTVIFKKYPYTSAAKIVGIQVINQESDWIARIHQATPPAGISVNGAKIKLIKSIGNSVNLKLKIFSAEE